MRDDQRPVLLLAGRSWLVNHVDWGRRIAYVEPSEMPGRSRWLGTGQPLHYELCQAVRNLLCRENTPEYLSQRARRELESLREDFSWCNSRGTAVIREASGKAKWWTFGGLLANAAIADRLKREGLEVGQADNFGIPIDAQSQVGNVEHLVAGIRGTDPAEIVMPVDGAAIDNLKFSACLPPAIARKMLQGRMTDALAIRSILSENAAFVNIY
jgi:ATP-dependent Lhr-like helicase